MELRNVNNYQCCPLRENVQNIYFSYDHILRYVINHLIIIYDLNKVMKVMIKFKVGKAVRKGNPCGVG